MKYIEKKIAQNLCYKSTLYIPLEISTFQKSFQQNEFFNKLKKLIPDHRTTMARANHSTFDLAKSSVLTISKRAPNANTSVFPVISFIECRQLLVSVCVLNGAASGCEKPKRDVKK